MGKLLLQRINALLHHADDLGMLKQLFQGCIADAVLFGILLQQVVLWNDESRNELALVSNDGNLVYESVHRELGLQCLR